LSFLDKAKRLRRGFSFLEKAKTAQLLSPAEAGEDLLLCFALEVMRNQKRETAL
jgi:hypothetical protein